MKYLFLLTIAASGFAAGCDSPEVKAKKLGFDSIELMQEYNKRGYKTMAQYIKANDFTAEKFYEQCHSYSEKQYNENCKGKKVSWRGLIERISDKSVRIQVLLENNMYPKKVFSVDTNAGIPHSLHPEIGKIVYFDGEIGNKNFVTPDIDDFKPYRVNNDGFLEERKIALKKELYEDFQKNKGNYNWLKQNFSPKIDLLCGNAVELRAKNSYRWTNGALEFKFPILTAHESKNGFIMAYGENIQFQNGFGVWRRVLYECTYDALNESVFSVRVK